jgi:uncharacterized Fe-S cluster protein YjdI
MATRTYSNGELSILWQTELCTHCETCWKGLPQVFDPQKRPWVTMVGATTAEIRKQVEQCPSGALSVIEQETPC